MNRTSLLLVLPFLALSSLATPLPSGYYDTCQGQKDSVLKSSLSLLARQGDRYHYGKNDTYHEARIAASDTTVYGVFYHAGDTIYKKGEPKKVTWQAFPLTDRNPDGTVWDMYSNTRRFFPVTNGESGCELQIEHCMPKSWWGASSVPDPNEDKAYCDLFNLNPSDAAANNNKSNYPPGMVTKADKFNNGSFKMDSKEACQYGNFSCFEPADCYKGDFARTYLYMVTAYENYTWSTQSPASVVLDNSTYLELRPQYIELLLQWHRADPVSQKEIDRQNAISSIQSNRNPYIDYPELVEYIWGNKKGQQVDFTQLTCTQDPSYQPPKEHSTFEAYAATNVYSNFFVANWNGFFSGPYKVEVYTQRHMEGQNDTLFNYPAFGKNDLDKIPDCTYNSKIQSAGSQSILMGSSNGKGSDGYVILNKLNLKQAATLSFRACKVSAVGSTGQLDIYLNDHTKPDTSITDFQNDELTYTFALPAGTNSIKLLSVGESTRKRVCMQALYIYSGNEHEQLSYVIDPMTISSSTSKYGDTISTEIKVPNQPGQQLYYRVTTPNGWVSNEVPVTLGNQPMIRHHVTTQTEHGTVSGAGIYQQGTTATLTVTADPYYIFSQWSDGNTDNPRQLVVMQDTLMTARIIRDPKYGTLTINYTLGKVKVNGKEHASGTSKFYPIGDTLSLETNKVNYYEFVGWSDSVSDLTRKLIITCDTTLETIYKVRSYKVTVNATNGTVEGGGWYPYNSLVTLTATPNKDYAFSEWQDDKGNTLSKDNPYSFTLNKAGITIRAVFVSLSALDETEQSSGPICKTMQNGQLLIHRNKRTYTALGATIQ